MVGIEHKWYDNVDLKGRPKITFILKRINSKQIAKLTAEQRKSALKNIEYIEEHFKGFIAELKKLLES